MFKKSFISLLVSSFLLGSATPSMANRRHNWDIFETSGAINVRKGTGADHLHAMGIKGKGRTIAIIDEDFLPPKDINKKGLLHPLAKKLKTVSLNGFKPYKNLGRDYHGTDVMNTAHMIAPQARILPIDVNYSVFERESITESPMVRAVRIAMNAKVDVINLSIYTMEPDPSYIDILKEAMQKGIAIIFAAGNDSSKKKPSFVSKVKDHNGRVCSSRNEMRAFEQAGRKGMLFAGSIGLDAYGNEKYTDFSTHATKDTNNHYLTTFGEAVASPRGALFGTSFAAPIQAASYALMMQYTKSLKGSVSSHALLNDLRASGHSITHNIPGTPVKTYKVLNLVNAAKRISDRVKAVTAKAKSVARAKAVKKVKAAAAKKLAALKVVNVKKTRAIKEAKVSKAVRAKKLAALKVAHQKKVAALKKATETQLAKIK